MCTKSFKLSLVTALLSAASVWASSPTGPARIQGVVKDSKGQAVAGAEVHIQIKDESGFEKIVRTDSNGQYGVSGLPVANYEVVLLVNGQVKASLSHQRVFGDKPTQLDFKLTGQYASKNQKKHTHMVYVPSETGSHLGGHWVEVDDATGAGAAGGVGPVDHVTGEGIRQMQGTSGTGGH
jgi:carboxypeptidase family protein